MRCALLLPVLCASAATPACPSPIAGVVSVAAGAAAAAASAVVPDVASDAPAATSVLKCFPLDGQGFLTDTFGDPRAGHRHAGCDILAARSTPIVAVSRGRVDWIQDGRNGRCCGIGLLHPDGSRTRYMHLDDETLRDNGSRVGIVPGLAVGAEVEAGALLGWVGNSGNAKATEPHLHFELWAREGQAVDPYARLRVLRPQAAVDPRARTPETQGAAAPLRLARAPLRRIRAAPGMHRVASRDAASHRRSRTAPVIAHPSAGRSAERPSA